MVWTSTTISVFALFFKAFLIFHRFDDLDMLMKHIKN